MKKLFERGCILLVALLALVLLPGCFSATQATITEYDAAGKITKVTSTSESVVTSLTQSTKNKTVVAWESGWAAYVSGSTATTEDPTPHIKLFAGKTDRGWISALERQQHWDGIAQAIAATQQGLVVGASGITNTSSDTAATTK